MVFVAHPRTEELLDDRERRAMAEGGVMLIEPLGYLDFLALEAASAGVLTDSGGVQEETTVLGVPCLTLRDETERPVTVTSGTNRVVGMRADEIGAIIDDIGNGQRPRPARPHSGTVARRNGSSRCSRIGTGRTDGTRPLESRRPEEGSVGRFPDIGRRRPQLGPPDPSGADRLPDGLVRGGPRRRAALRRWLARERRASGVGVLDPVDRVGRVALLGTRGLQDHGGRCLGVRVRALRRCRGGLLVEGARATAAGDACCPHLRVFRPGDHVPIVLALSCPAGGIPAVADRSTRGSLGHRDRIGPPGRELLLSSGAQEEVVLVDATAFASAALLAASLLLHHGSGLGVWRLALAAGAFLMYAFFVFSGFGRLTLGALGLAIGIVSTKWFRGRVIKAAILVLSAPTLVILSVTRVAFTASLNPDQGAIGVRIRDQSTHGVRATPGDARPAPAGVRIDVLGSRGCPGASWDLAEQTPGFGAVLVPILDPRLVGTGHSEAALAHGEWLYNFGLIGLVLMIPVLSVIVRAIDAWLEAVNSRPILDHRRLLAFVGASIAAAGLVDLVWVGTFTWVARSGSRLLVIGALAILSSLTASARAPSPRVHGPPRPRCSMAEGATITTPGRSCSSD